MGPQSLPAPHVPHSTSRATSPAPRRHPFLLLLSLAMALLAGCHDERALPTAPVREPSGPNLLVMGGGSFTRVSAGYLHTCALRGDGVVECWGYNGLGQAPATKSANSGSFTQVSAGLEHTCARRTDGQVECWGSDQYGQAPATKSASSGTFTQVSAGGYHTCARTTAGTVECWGAGASPEAGAYPNFGQAPATRSAGSGTFTQVSAGRLYTCARRTDSAVECWGWNGQGQVTRNLQYAEYATATHVGTGTGVFADVAASVEHTCVRRVDAFVECWGIGVAGGYDSLPPLRPYAQVSTGREHNCALRLSIGHAVDCWGRNDYGQAPATKTPIRGEFIQVSAGEFHTCAVRDDGVVECWGAAGVGNHGQAPATRGPTPTHIQPTASFSAMPASVTAGQSFTLALTGAQIPSHPEATQFTYAFDCGDGSGYASLSGTANRTCPTSAAGTRTVKGLVIDQDGDEAEYTASVEVVPAEVVPAVISPTVGGTSGNNGWYTGDVQVNWTVTVGGTPVSPAPCPATPITTDTPGQQVTCSYGGASQSVTVKRDATPPTISLTTPASGAAYALNQVVNAAYGCQDPTGGSGLAACTGTVGTGGALNTGTAGPKSFTVDATDAAGNTATLTRSYTVGQATQAITFASTPPEPAHVGGSYAVSASGGGSGNAIVFSSLTPTICAVSGNTVALNAAGTCTVAANQAGNADYLAAPQQTQGFAISVADASPPAITPSVSDTPGANGWYTSSVTVSWTVVDDESAITSPACAPTTISTDTPGQTVTCSATSAGGTFSRGVTIKRDATRPEIALATRLPAANGSGWNTGNVTVTWSCTDATSGATSATVSQTVSAQGQNQSATGTCTDHAGNTASGTQGGISIDRTAPALSPSVSPSPVLLNGSATASPNASDALSGVASASCGAVSTAAVGTGQTVTCTATDAAGNLTTAGATYAVTYTFGGFQAPVNNGTTLNVANAGQTVPLKWQITNAAGAPVTSLAAATLTVLAISCPAGVPTDPVETSGATSNAGLQNLGGGNYQLNWSTQKSWGGSCRRLQLNLGEGAPRTADFRFK